MSKRNEIKVFFNEAFTDFGIGIGLFLKGLVSRAFIPVYIFLFLLIVFMIGAIVLSTVSNVALMAYAINFPLILIAVLTYYAFVTNKKKGE